jgi:energy-coupling factor transporter ATP-binding protein EcfA2
LPAGNGAGKPAPRMIRELTIKNYKSILDHTIELGRINVFIGENGCGKTNILEAVAMAGAALTDKLSVEELFNRGMRVAKPSIMRSSFPGARSKDIVIECGSASKGADASRIVELRIAASEASVADVRWHENRGSHDVVKFAIDLESGPDAEEQFRILVEAHAEGKLIGFDGAVLRVDARGSYVVTGLERKDSGGARVTVVGPSRATPERVALTTLVGDFAIYNANALALRGLQTVSRRTPLGIHGETLDFAISALPPKVWEDVVERAKCVSWLDNIEVDVADQLKYQGDKLGKSQSTLYFHDKYMRRKNNVFSAENVNEGILHILFHLTLFVSEGTPRVLGIDNIDTALNPQLCRDLMKQLAELAAKHDKQALLTTHNPAILDGLNLHDDEQRLFVVYRNDDGHTQTKRIKAKPQPDGQKLKLSELWMRGHLGGIPRSF